MSDGTLCGPSLVVRSRSNRANQAIFREGLGFSMWNVYDGKQPPWLDYAPIIGAPQVRHRSLGT